MRPTRRADPTTKPARTLGWCAALTGVFAAAPGSTLAGMPVVVLSDIAELRLQVISFFLAAFLLSAWGVKGVWNALRKDFPTLPHLSYKRALAFVFLWGLAFNLVLTMISGARELMTPGAWDKEGLTYRLSPEADSPPDESAEP